MSGYRDGAPSRDAEVKRLITENEALRGKVAKLSAKPARTPAQRYGALALASATGAVTCAEWLSGAPLNTVGAVAAGVGGGALALYFFIFFLATAE